MIQIHNQSAGPSDRWIRCTVRPQDIPNGARAWRQGPARFAVAGPVGIAAVELDVRVPLAAGQRMTFDPAAGVAEAPAPVVLPPEAVRDPVGYFGVPISMGTVLEFQSATPEGAALLAVFRSRDRVVPQFVHELTIRYRPDEGSWLAWYRLTNSNVAGPQLLQAILPQDLVLRMGTWSSSVLAPAGDYWGCGGSRVWELWIGGPAPSDRVDARGIDRIGPMADLVPDTTFPQGRFDVQGWISRQTPHMEAQMGKWASDNTLGITANSTQTGDQEEQGAYQGVESFYPGGMGAIRVNRLCVLSEWPRRPYHHCEPEGVPLIPERHSRGLLWQCLPHYQPSISPDRFGMTVLPTPGSGHNNYGPDDEHWLMHRPAAQVELDGNPIAQQELDWLARCWLMSDVIDPSKGVAAHARAARARGYAGIAVADWWRLLNDRILAGKVRDRWIPRLAIYMAAEPNPTVTPWDLRASLDSNGHPTSSALGPIDTARWRRFSMTYQMAVGVYGVWIACKTLGLQDGVRFAVQSATTCMHASYSPSENPARVWEQYDTVGVGDDGQFATSADGRNQTSDWYRAKWLPLCLVPVLFDGDAQAKLQAKSIRDTLLREVTQATEVGRTYANQPADWFPPVPQDAGVPS